MKTTLTRWLCAILAGAALAPAALRADALSRPESLSVDAAGPTLRWAPVDGAKLYRVAVFDAPDLDGKRPLLAAVWVRGSEWAYGQGATVPKAARLVSTHPLPLPAGHLIHFMVAAAGEDGADKSDWSGVDLQLPARPGPLTLPAGGSLSPAAAAVAVTADAGLTGTAVTLSASASAVTLSASASAVALSASADAELDISGGEEFTSSPEPAVLDLTDAAKVGTPGAPSVAAGQALLKSAKDEDAEAVFRSVLDKDAANADAWEGLGDSYVDRRMKVEAAEAYQKALELDKTKTRLKAWLEDNVRP